MAVAGYGILMPSFFSNIYVGPPPLSLFMASLVERILFICTEIKKKIEKEKKKKKEKREEKKERGERREQKREEKREKKRK